MYRSVLCTLSILGLSLTVIADSRTDDAAKKAGGRPKSGAKTPTVIVAPGNDSIGLARELPKIWIGVRVTPVPEALAAHIGRGGLMIGNLITGGPADLAGVERYDVLVSINDEKIEDMAQLVDAVSKVGTGKTATLVVIRGGKERTLQITPADRDVNARTALKFEEAPSDVDQDVQYFGHRIARDPLGNWTFSPQGKMNLPDDVKDSLGDPSSPTWQGLKDWRDFLRSGPFAGQLNGDPMDPMLLFSGDEDDASADRQVQIQISVNENGQETNIQRDADGKVVVRRTDPNGGVTEKSFDTLDTFRAEDSEGYKLFRQFTGYRSRTMITLPPEMKGLDVLQGDFQKQLRESLEESQRVMQQSLEETRRLQESLKRSPKSTPRN